MRLISLIFLFLMYGNALFAQNNIQLSYEPSPDYPYGRINPEAPKIKSIFLKPDN